MPALSKRYKPRGQNYGTEFDMMKTGSINTLVASATTQYAMGGISDAADVATKAYHAGYIDEVLVAGFAVAAGSAGITLTIKKRDALNAATRTLVTTFDLKSLTALASKRLPFDAAVTDRDRTMQPGDFLYAEIVLGGTVTTQPILSVNAFVALLT